MKRVGDLIPAIFDERFIEKTTSYSTFFSCWEDMMVKNGIAAAAGHSWIKSAEKGLVWIEVDHPGWKQIIQTKESKLLHDFRYRFPDMGISGISIVFSKPGNREQVTGNKEEREIANKVGASGEKTPAERTKASVDQEPVGSVAEPQAKYGAIKDEALRELLERLEKHIAEREGHSSS